MSRTHTFTERLTVHLLVILVFPFIDLKRTIALIVGFNLPGRKKSFSPIKIIDIRQHENPQSAGLASPLHVIESYRISMGVIS